MSVQLQFEFTAAEMREARKIALKRLRSRRRIIRGLTGWIVFVTLAIILVFLISNRTAPPATPPPPTPSPASGGLFSQMIVPLIPWVLIFGFVWFFVVRQLRARNTQTGFFKESHTVAADDNGLIWMGNSSRTEYLWRAFRGFDQTPTLFILYQDDREESRKTKQVRFIPVPKRAFTNPQMLAEFQRLLDSHVHSQAGAFPVIPLAAAHAE
ncbi:MAG TPA: YcxB family protein [Tepidisphaeraceae bacterium]|jgi:hypothetical protein|nr:YcxB family protein [Tepidisphaeraceae bacterium]